MFLTKILLLAIVPPALSVNNIELKKISDFVNTKDISPQCLNQIENLSALNLLKMYDASTKIPSGILVGNLFDLGNFDECYSIEENTEIGTIFGKYCLGTIHLDIPGLPQNITTNIKTRALQPQPRILTFPQLTGFHWAICIPSGCRSEEFSIISDYLELLCYSKDTEPELSTGAIVTIIFLAFVLAIVTCSTIYDVFLYYTEKKTIHELLIAFSLLSNGRKLFNLEKKPGQLSCLNGIKAISMMWVILYHEFVNIDNAPVNNLLDMLKYLDDTFNMYILRATISVDSFLLVGGLVTVYTFLKAKKKINGPSLIFYYLHRYLRLAPVLAALILIHAQLIKYFGNGPLWALADLTFGETCRDTGWWTTLLFLGNYVDKGNPRHCMPQTWYLAVDMQLYVLTPLILFPLTKWPKLALGGLGILTIAGVIAPWYVGYVNKYISMGGTDLSYYKNYYYATHARFGPYVIGMILGYIIFKITQKKTKPHLKPILICVLWAISLGALVVCVYAGHDLMLPTDHYDIWAQSLHFGFNRNAWAVALSILILLCLTGYGGPIDSFLSLPIFTLLTRLSYSTYLIHFTLLTIRYLSMKEVFQFSTYSLLHSFWGDFMFTIGISVVISLIFESPVIILEKYLFKSIESLLGLCRKGQSEKIEENGKT